MAQSLSALIFPDTEFGSPTNSSPGQTAQQGTSVLLARADHVHGREAALTPAGTVSQATSFGSASTIGSSLAYAREDHAHGTPSLSSVAPGSLTYGSAGIAGSGSSAARSDHTHALPAPPVSPVLTLTQAATAVAGSIYLANGTFSVALPTPAANAQIVVKNIGTGLVTLTSGALIDGQSSVQLRRYVSLSVVSDGANWYII